MKNVWRIILLVSLFWTVFVSMTFAQEKGFDPGSIQGVVQPISKADYGTEKNNQGYLLREAGQFDQAEALFKEALKYWDEHPPTSLQGKASCLNNLGLLYASQRKYAEAIPVYQQALVIENNSLPPDSMLLALILDNLAQSYRLLGQVDEAEPLYKKALDVEQKICPNSQDNAITMFNLSLLYFQQKKYDQCEPLMVKSLAILKDTLGATNPDYLQVHKYYLELLARTNRSKI